jgi:hypothetical protein
MFAIDGRAGPHVRRAGTVPNLGRYRIEAPANATRARIDCTDDAGRRIDPLVVVDSATYYQQILVSVTANAIASESLFTPASSPLRPLVSR